VCRCGTVVWTEGSAQTSLFYAFSFVTIWSKLIALRISSRKKLNVQVLWQFNNTSALNSINRRIIFFYVLLTVHLSIFISVINQLNAQNFCFTISLFHASTCFEHMCSSLHSLWYHYTFRCDDTRGCVMQFWPLDDEHMCSKHVEVWNVLIVKQTFCSSSWLITEGN